MNYNFKNFEQEIDPEILKSGQKYFEEGRVTELEEEEKGQWVGTVSGQEEYEVEADISRNRVKYHDCSCGYDAGPICKHAVALLFAVRATTSGKPVKAVKEQASSKRKLYLEILDNVNYQDLRAFLLELALKKKDFGSLLLSRFAEYSGVEGKEKYTLIIKNSISAAADRSGFIDTDKLKLVAKPVSDLLANAENAISKQFYADAVNICQAVIENLVPKLQYFYDTKRQIQSAIEKAFVLLEKLAAESIPMPLQDALFEYVLQAINNKEYDRVGLNIYWLGLLDVLAKDKTSEKQVTEFVQSELQRLGKVKTKGKVQVSRRYGISYNSSEAEERKYAYFLAKFYQNRNQITELKQLLGNYKHLSEFIELLIGIALKEEQYLSAKNLAKSALITAKQNRDLHLALTLEKWLLIIAEAEKDIPQIRETGLSMYLKTYNLKLLKAVKNTFKPEEWLPVYEQIKQEVLQAEQQSWRDPENAVALMTVEKDWPALVHLLDKKPSLGLITQVAKALPEEYNTKLLQLLQTSLQEFASQNTNKTSYKEVGKTIKFIETLPNGKPVAKQLLNDFKKQYKMRSNMMEVLNKIYID